MNRGPPMGGQQSSGFQSSGYPNSAPTSLPPTTGQVPSQAAPAPTVARLGFSITPVSWDKSVYGKVVMGEWESDNTSWGDPEYLNRWGPFGLLPPPPADQPRPPPPAEPPKPPSSTRTKTHQCNSTKQPTGYCLTDRGLERKRDPRKKPKGTRIDKDWPSNPNSSR